MQQSQTEIARQRWELENNIQPLTDADQLFIHNEQKQRDIQNSKPWQRDPGYFKNVKMSALALLKIALHAKSGGKLEIMGMMTGRTEDDTFIVLDSFALPVEGTETRVNAQEQAYEFLVQFQMMEQENGRKENVVGWYHSHPGYGCWLSGIDCSTQMLNQGHQEPFLAVVIDPVRTMSAGKVEIGAFRTYPENYTPPNAQPSEYQSIPLAKMEDFGVHANQYYKLDISFFKSSLDGYILDLLWNKYWINTLSSSPLLATKDYIAGQINDVAEKMEQAEQKLMNRIGRMAAMDGQRKQEDSQLTKIAKDTSTMAAEQIKGLATQVIKQLVFNTDLIGSHQQLRQPDEAMQEL